METIGYLSAIFIGISLGLMGGGGSILTVPVLVYLFKINPVLATTYSLFIVSTTSTIGSFSYIRKQLIHLKTAIVFGIPSIITVILTRKYIIPIIPEEIFDIKGFAFTKNILLMILFATLMIFASYKMIKKCPNCNEDDTKTPIINYKITLLQGSFLGVVTGLVGAGGGFLIIPTLINFVKLSMKRAVGTSLIIISANSIIGFVFSLHNTTIDWHFLISISSFSIIGILIGSFFSKKINGKKLKPIFGWFVLATGVYILFREFFKIISCYVTNVTVF